LFRTTSSLKITVIPTWQLLLYLGVFLIPDIVILVVWTAAFTPQALLVTPNRYFLSDWYSVCSSSGLTTVVTPTDNTIDTAFVAALGAYKGALLLAGMIITFLLRKVPSEFNEAKYIGYAVYNLAFCILLLLIIWRALPISQYFFSAIAREVVILWALFISVAFIFLPKMYFVVTGRKSDLKGGIARGTTRTRSAVSDADTAGNTGTESGDMPSLKLQALEAEVQQLRAELAALKNDNAESKSASVSKSE